MYISGEENSALGSLSFPPIAEEPPEDPPRGTWYPESQSENRDLSRFWWTPSFVQATGVF